MNEASLPGSYNRRAPASARPAPARGASAFCLGLVLFFCGLVLAPLPSFAEQGFIVKGFSLGGTDTRLEINLQLLLKEEANLANMLRDGAKMEMTCQVQFLRKRSFWSDEALAENTIHSRLRHDPLLREFVVSTGETAATRGEDFHRLMEETWGNLSIPLENPGGLVQDEDYLVKVTVSLKHSEMPPWLTRSILFWSDEIIPPTTFELDMSY